MQQDPKKDVPLNPAREAGLPVRSPQAKEGESLLQEKKDVWEKAREESALAEKKELEKTKLPAEDEKAIQEQLKKEIELMQLDAGLAGEAQKQAQKIGFLDEEEKLAHLLAIAKEKGLAFAVNVAKNMNDPFILDSFHDILAKEGFYQKFLKK